MKLTGCLGLELGADDYVVKPFSVLELLLRAKVILGRLSPKQDQKLSVLRHDDIITVDLDAHKVTKGDEKLIFTATEFKLLAELMRYKARSREQLLSSVWGILLMATPARWIRTCAGFATGLGKSSIMSRPCVAWAIVSESRAGLECPDQLKQH